jgi:ABC-type nitrate/sulfonate/bicarbonate transport system substrate-binding protein
MKKPKYFSSLILLFMLALTGCNKAPTEEPKSDATPTPAKTEPGKISMAYQPIVFGMPVFVAQDQKFFEKNNLIVDAKSFTSANDMINALVAGQVDMVPGAPLVPVLSLESQYPGRFRVFAHSIMTMEKPFDRILVKTNSNINSVADLAGKKLALIPGTTAMNAMKAYLKNNGIDPASITYVQLAPTAQLAALQSDAVDALYAYEPVLTIALEQGNLRAISPSVYCSLLNPCPLVVSIVDRKFEKENPEVTQNAIKALDEAVQLMRDDPVKASASLANYTKVQLAITPKVSLQNMTIGGNMDLTNMQQFIDILLGIGEIKSKVSAENLVAPTR